MFEIGMRRGMHPKRRVLQAWEANGRQYLALECKHIISRPTGQKLPYKKRCELCPVSR